MILKTIDTIKNHVFCNILLNKQIRLIIVILQSQKKNDYIKQIINGMNIFHDNHLCSIYSRFFKYGNFGKNRKHIFVLDKISSNLNCIYMKISFSRLQNVSMPVFGQSIMLIKHILIKQITLKSLSIQKCNQIEL